jgi:hypothetical protein
MVVLRSYGADPTQRDVFSLIRENVCRGSIHLVGTIGYSERDEYGPYGRFYAQQKIQSLMLKLVSLSIMYAEKRQSLLPHFLQ